MIARSLHAGRPFILGRNCVDMGDYELCHGKNLLVVNEVDAGEVFDITLYRSMAIFTEGGFMDKMLRGAIVEAMKRFSVPDAHANIGYVLPLEPLPAAYEPVDDPWGYIEKPGTIAKLPQLQYIRILRSSRCEDDYIDGVAYTGTVVAIYYRVETLTHVAKRHIDTIARSVEEKYGIPADEVKNAILSEISMARGAITTDIGNAVRRLAEKGYIGGVMRTSELENYIVNTIYSIVENGGYIKPRPIAIAAFRDGARIAGGCKVLDDNELYDLPEEDLVDLKKQCANQEKGRQ